MIYACIKAAADAADPYKSIIIIAFQMAMKYSMAAPEMLPNSISEHLIFKIFLGGHAPRPPRISMLRMLIVLSTIYV